MPMNAQTWYVRRGRQVRGPFPASVVANFRARGKLGDGDEVSCDLETWRPVGEIASRRRNFREPRATATEAAGEPGAPGEEHGAATPGPTPAPVAARSDYVERLMRQRDNRWLQGAVVAGLLASILAAALSLDDRSDVKGADCLAAAAPGVNWSSCGKDAAQLAGVDLRGALLNGTRVRDADFKGARLTNANLAYADFGASTLAYADLVGASLKGATLKGADLGSADLTGADLSYADLTGARLGGARLDGAVLDNAIWNDGRVCAVGSLGACR